MLRWCGVAGVLGGTLYVAWGYIENLEVVMRVLSFIVPALFLTAVVGLSVLWRSQLGVLGWTGMALAVYGSGRGIEAGIMGSEPEWAYFTLRGWPHHLSDWLS